MSTKRVLVLRIGLRLLLVAVGLKIAGSIISDLAHFAPLILWIIIMAVAAIAFAVVLFYILVLIRFVADA